jgi:hypothetical protein
MARYSGPPELIKFAFVYHSPLMSRQLPP